ncbi:zinc finger BED domain-containing protein RICESLEEPER 3-like [Nicotiana tabacum]|uniref:Zinc finger BED domain-containing protein RICESLEEPER 3-like n=1 Tax=Nicotiana tabacum TaxID=4097 RepID=A0A1S3Z1W7_TOBAC
MTGRVVTSRWNSTYLMLESSLPYEKVFASLHLHDRSYAYSPTSDQWRRAEKICEALEPFYEITNLISGSSYPTSNLYFMQVWRIECMLKEKLNNEDKVIKDMASKMHEKFEKYWKEYSIILAFGAILDTRMKLQFSNFCYSKLDPISAQEKRAHVKNKLYKLYEHYANKQNIASASSSTLTTSSEDRSRPTKGFKIFSEFKTFEDDTASSNGKSELDLYLEEPKLDLEKFQDMDVVMYWKDHSRKYPDLSVMARDILSIPITIVASESTFSIGGHVLTKYRSCIHHENVQILVTTRNWLHGFSHTQTGNIFL